MPIFTTLVSLKDLQAHLNLHPTRWAYCEDLGLGVPKMRIRGMDTDRSVNYIFVFTRLGPGPGDTLLFLSEPQ